MKVLLQTEYMTINTIMADSSASLLVTRRLPSKHTTWLQHRYNVAATSRRCKDVVTTLLRRCVFAG